MTNYIERYWRDAKPEDAIKEPPMVARFSQEYCPDWVIDKLIYWDRSETPWHREDGFCYDLCQVYDAPDPGEGWRLIDTANEKWQESDEIYEQSTGTWRKRLTPFQDGALSVNRRRIEPPKPEPRYEPFRWEDRDQLRGRLITYVDRNRTVEFRCESFAVDDYGLIVNDAYADWLCKHAVFVDTKEPVGKKVMK